MGNYCSPLPYAMALRTRRYGTWHLTTSHNDFLIVFYLLQINKQKKQIKAIFLRVRSYTPSSIYHFFLIAPSSSQFFKTSMSGSQAFPKPQIPHLSEYISIWLTNPRGQLQNLNLLYDLYIQLLLSNPRVMQ